MNKALKNAQYMARTSRTQQQLEVGQAIVAQDAASGQWTMKGEVVAVRPHGRSYVIASEGQTYLRTRQHIRPVNSVDEVVNNDDPVDPDENSSDDAPYKNTRARARRDRERGN